MQHLKQTFFSFFQLLSVDLVSIQYHTVLAMSILFNHFLLTLLALNVIFVLQKRGETMNERLRALRELLNKSQDEFGKDLGLSRNYISLLENGQRNLSEQSIKVLCNEFSVNENWLRTGQGDMFKPRTKNEELLSFVNDVMELEDDSFKKKLVNALAKLDTKDWECLENIASKLSEE